MSDTPVTDRTFDDALQAMLDMNPNSLLHRMGIEVLEGSPERVVARMPVEGITQPYGLLHGAASRSRQVIRQVQMRLSWSSVTTTS